MMTMMEWSGAINRAQRALKALGEHPRSSRQELGHAREHLNACYSHGDSDSESHRSRRKMRSERG